MDFKEAISKLLNKELSQINFENDGTSRGYICRVNESLELVYQDGWGTRHELTLYFEGWEGFE